MTQCFHLSASNTPEKLKPVCADALAFEQLLLCRGLSFGQGLFETILVHDAQPQLWSEHMHRLQRGAKALGLCFYPDLVQAASLALVRDQAATKSEMTKTCILKITLFSAEGSVSGYAGLGKPEDAYLRLEIKPFVSSVQGELCAVRIKDPLYPAPAQLRGLKLTNALCYVHWSRFAKAHGFDQGVLFDERGLLVEGTHSNVLLVSDTGVLQTPAMKAQGVWGTLRHHLLDKQMIVEADLNEQHLYASKAVYFFNSLRGLQQLRTYSGSRGEKKWCVIQGQNDIKSLSSLLDYVRTYLVGID